MVHTINHKNTQQSIGDHFSRKRKMGACQNCNKVGQVYAAIYSSLLKKIIQAAANKAGF
jgi:excinuclease UvrABC ATPase subunit